MREEFKELEGYNDMELSTQIVIKEALERGLEVTIMDREENFIKISDGKKVEYIKQATKSSLDSYVTALIMENKVVSKTILKENGIRVPLGENFNSASLAKESYDKFRDKDIVIKPKSTNFGIGITILKKPLIKDDFERAVDFSFKYDTTTIIEEFVEGREFRFLVMDDEVMGILHRVAANVCGDGKLTIEELVEEKNRDSLRGENYNRPLQKIVFGEAEIEVLKEQGLDKSDILKMDETIYLRNNSNISNGGDSIDFTDDILDEYKEIAIKSSRAVNARICGVDMLIGDITKEAKDENYAIIEVNFNPALHIHRYPYKGESRYVEKKLLDILGFDHKDVGKL